MANSLSAKKNLSSVQVLKTLLVLLEGDYTMTELVEKLNSKEKKPIFNNSVVSKYISTCRHAGINIPKISGRYYISSMPFGLEFTDRETDLIDYIQKIGKEILSVLFNKRLSEFIKNLRKYSNRNIMRVEISSENAIRKKFEDAVRENRQIRLIYRSKEVIDCNPLDIVLQKGKLYFFVNHSGKEKYAAFDRITGLEILNKTFLPKDNNGAEVVFKLSGGLAKRYALRENEVLTDSTEDYIIVTNKGEEKSILISRLLRYDSLCEVMEPLSFREEMKDTINKMISNYEV